MNSRAAVQVMSVQDDVLILTGKQDRLQKELQDVRARLSNAAHELEGVRLQLTRSQERLTILSRALEFMKNEAEIVSLDEYRKVKDLVDENAHLVKQHRTMEEAAKNKGKAASEYLQDVTQKLDATTKELSNYGKVIPLPRRQVVDEEEGPDYVDDP
jgi:chromosome segregation ATPase